jgi:hypothetical protein
MKFKVKYILIMFSLLLQRCNSPEKKEEDFIGVWKSEDGAEIELRADGTYVARRIGYYNIYTERSSKNKRIDFAGEWNVVKGGTRLELQTEITFAQLGINKKYIRGGELRGHRFGLTLEVSGDGFFANKPPWCLFIWTGDPNVGKKYKFIKLPRPVLVFAP